MPLSEHRLRTLLLDLLAIDSPTGRCQAKAAWVAEYLRALGIATEVTRRGAIRALLPATGTKTGPALAMAAHLDTLGAMVTGHHANGRARMTPLGSLSARVVEGARVRLEQRDGQQIAGSVMPLKASGHRFGAELEGQPISWDNLELRLDIMADWCGDTASLKDAAKIGDYVFFDPEPQVFDSGLIKARFIDNQAGTAILLALAEALIADPEPRPRDLYLVFSVTEEVGSGGAHLLTPDVAELIAVDIAVNAPDQGSSAIGVTLVHKDKGGPYDYDLTRALGDIASALDLTISDDVFRYYFSDTFPATQAGFDCRMALVCYACEATHGHERGHMTSILETGRLLLAAAKAAQLA